MIKKTASDLARRFLHRPDIWAVTVAFLAFITVLATTSLTVARASRLAYNHLADSFAVGLFSAVAIIFIEGLLRHAPAGPRRALRLVWIGLTLLLTAGLLFTYARDELYRTNWFLQGLVLALLGTGALLGLLLPGLGLVRWRDTFAVVRDLGRQWGPIMFFLMFGGYLLAAVRLAHPAVLDAILLRMDFSLGVHLGERFATWTADHPWAIVTTNYGYPLLGAVIAGVAACLHLKGDLAGLRRALLACILVSLLGKFCYSVAPAIGPIFAYPELYSGTLPPGGIAELDALRTIALAGPDFAVMHPDLSRNVMPSLHTSFTLVVLAAAWCHRRRLFWWWLPLGAVLIITTLTLVVHYVVDLIAAVPFSIFCWWLADAGVRRFAPDGAVPLPDLVVTDPRRRQLSFALAGSLALALALLVLWGKFAPLPPWLAWPVVLLVTALPTWLAVKLLRQTQPGFVTLSAPSLNSQPSTLNSPSSSAPRLLAGAVFCTGGTALVLEQVAEKYLSTLLGASRPAATIVLAVYFAGLALGALLCPRRTAGAPRRLALLELFIAAWAALLAAVFFASDRALGEWLAATGTDATSLVLARTALAVLWLLPPTMAMGAQLPTLAALLAGHSSLRDQSLPRYYAINLAGAFTFTLAAPLALFNPFGANGALWCIALLATLVGVALWSGLPAAEPAPPPTVSSPAPSRSLSRAPLLLAFAAGFGFFALEIVWFHLISVVCGASTYSFSILLASVLLGLALAGRHTARRTPPPVPTTLGWVVLVLACSNALWPWAGRALATAASALDLNSFWSGEFLKFLAVSLLVIPPAFFLGQIFPQLLRASSADSAHVGRLSVANVLGCVAGALATGFFLIPSLGAEHTLFALALLLAVGWLFLRDHLVLRELIPGALGVILLFALPHWDRLELTRGYGVYLAPQASSRAELLSFREDFQAGFVTVLSTPREPPAAPVKSLLQNGKFDADDAGEVPAQVGFGLVAALHAPALDRALVIGAGSGQTASVVERLGFAHVDIAEISPAHLAAAREHFSHLNGNVFARNNVTVHLEDGRQHLLRTRERYDLIQIELTSVWFAGATNLYSQEFYALARSRLTPGGVLVQWVQLHHLTPREIATILATARAEFGRVSVWRVGGQICLLASDTPQKFNPAVVTRWRESPDLANERHVTHADTTDDFAVALLVKPSQLDVALNRYRGSVGINTDRNRWLEFQTPKYYLSHFNHTQANLHWLADMNTPAL